MDECVPNFWNMDWIPLLDEGKQLNHLLPDQADPDVEQVLIEQYAVLNCYEDNEFFRLSGLQ